MSDTLEDPVVDVASVETASVESRYHSYTGTRIPWYVRLIWLLFWCFAIYYVIHYLFPDLQTEILTPR